MNYKFPKNFYFGTATSSHQIEGSNKNNDWWRAEQEGKIKHKSGRACDSYNRYEEDFDLAKELGTNAHRLSIEWSRIEPEEGKFNEEEIKHYKNVIRALKARGLEPFVTLHHFTIPLWIADKGGWEHPRSPYYFARYAEYVVKNLPEVKFWITINEPFVLSAMSYMYGGWPPFKTGILRVLRVNFELYRAHKAAYKKIKNINSDLEVGLTKNVKYFKAENEGLISRVFVAVFDLILNFGFLDSLKHEQDFIGLNYYYPVNIKAGFSHPAKWMKQFSNMEKSDFDWDIYPKGLYKVVKHVSNFDKPIYIFENGIADADDDQRPDFIREHLKWLRRAMHEGADVRGYFHWSLLDNFEWAEGFKMRFGLVHVDFDTLKRTPRNSFYVYKKICESNILNS